MKAKMSSKSKKSVFRIILTLLIFIPLFITDKIVDLSAIGAFGWTLPFALYFIVYIIIGYDILFKAAGNIVKLNPLDENFLMCIATLGAFALAIYNGIRGERTEGFDEGCAVLIFYQVGELFQSIATERSRGSIKELMDLCPDRATVVRNGEIASVFPEEIRIGEIIVVRPGERVALDGEIVNGGASFDASALTGESVPYELSCGDKVMSGTICLTSTVEIKVEKEYTDSTATKILDLIENAADKKSKTESFITKFARWYTPTVVFLAVCLALIPSMITGNFSVWIYRALSFLVVSCPCAIVISVPMTYFMGIGACSKNHILIKGSDYLERLDKIRTFVFDKTGTVTTGELRIEAIYPMENADEILRLAATAESGSLHPIARSITRAYGKEIKDNYTVEDKSGYGILATCNDDSILCGSHRLMEIYEIECLEYSGECTPVYVAQNNRYVGVILLADEIKNNAKSVVAELQSKGAKCIMLTGDKNEITKKVAQSVGFSDYKSSLLPQDKVDYVEKEIFLSKKGEYVCFTGDGINDAPVLVRADIGVSMGSIGSDAAIEASDVVLVKDDLSNLVRAIKISKKTNAIAKQNILFPLFIKILILILSALGLANMWIAVFGDVGVSVLAIINAMRLGTKKKADRNEQCLQGYNA